MSDLQRKIEVLSPAHHGGRKGQNDPDAYGVGSVKIRFTLLGPKGAITWGISTGWYLPETYEYWKNTGKDRYVSMENNAMGYSVSIHVAEQIRDYYTGPDECDVLPEGQCYSDGSFLAGDHFFETLVRQGEEAVWKKMEEWYEDIPEGPEEDDD